MIVKVLEVMDSATVPTGKDVIVADLTCASPVYIVGNRHWTVGIRKEL